METQKIPEYWKIPEFWTAVACRARFGDPRYRATKPGLIRVFVEK